MQHASAYSGQPNPYQPPTSGAMVPAPSHTLAFSHTSYTIKQSYWAFLGRVTRVFAPDGSLVAYIKRPAFKWREELTIFADEGQTQPLLVIRARKAIAINMVRDVFDAATGQLVGSVRHRGWKSVVRDTWDILDAGEQPVGLMQEDGAALLRRFFPILLGKWHVELGGQPCAHVRQIFRFFAKEYSLDLSSNQGRMDPRFAMACAMLALMAETRREQSS